MDWTIRRWREAEETEALLAQVAASFEDPSCATAEFLGWAVKGSPARQGTVLVAEDQATGAIIGQVWTMCFDVQVAGRRLTCHQPFSLVTHPAHRRRGVWRSLLPAIIEHGAALGVPVSLGAAPPGHGQMVFDFGYVAIDQLALVTRVVDPGPLLARRLRRSAPPLLAACTAMVSALWRPWSPAAHSPPAGLTAERGARFDARFDGFWQRVKDKYPCMRVRDAAHQRWRFERCPTRRYSLDLLAEGDRIVAYIVTRQLDEGGAPVLMIVDALAELGARGQAAMRWLGHDAIGQAARQGMAAVSALLTAGSDELAALRRGGLYRVPELLRSRPLVMAARGDVATTPAAFSTPKAWHFTCGDFDFF